MKKEFDDWHVCPQQLEKEFGGTMLKINGIWFEVTNWMKKDRIITECRFCKERLQ